MIWFTESAKIDKDKWDKCISNSRANLIYGISWYLDLVSPGWCGIIEGDYSSVMPLPVKRKYGINYIIQPVFTQQLGIFSGDYCDQKKIIEFIRVIPSYFRFVDINLNFSNDAAGLPFTVKINTNYELKLSAGITEIRSGFSDNTSRNIHKAMAQVVIKENIPVNDHIWLVKRNSKVFMDNKHINWISIFAGKVIQMKAGWFVGAFVKGELCASVFLLKYAGRIYYLIPVSSKAGKEKRAMFAIVDYIIENYAGTDYVLDFEGSNHEGIARFYNGFGAELINYSRVRINHLPKLYKLFKKQD